MSIEQKIFNAWLEYYTNTMYDDDPLTRHRRWTLPQRKNGYVPRRYTCSFILSCIEEVIYSSDMDPQLRGLVTQILNTSLLIERLTSNYKFIREWKCP